MIMHDSWNLVMNLRQNSCQNDNGLAILNLNPFLLNLKGWCIFNFLLLRCVRHINIWNVWIQFPSIWGPSINYTDKDGGGKGLSKCQRCNIILFSRLTVLIHRCRSRFRERNICEARFCKSLNRLGYNKTGLVSKNLEYIK